MFKFIREIGLNYANKFFLYHLSNMCSIMNK